MKPDKADKRPAQGGLPDGRLSVRPTERPPARADVNATMKRLGLDVDWSEEAVQQLIDAAAAADEYLRQFPEQAETLARDPKTVLREMADKGFLATPMDALETALAATTKQVGKRKPPKNPFRVTEVRFEDSTADKGAVDG